jgi:hypothetical protein
MIRMWFRRQELSQSKRNGKGEGGCKPTTKRRLREELVSYLEVAERSPQKKPLSMSGSLLYPSQRMMD